MHRGRASIHRRASWWVVASWVLGAWGVGWPLLASPSAGVDDGLRLACFDVDATPSVGGAMAYGSVVRGADLPLRCRGVVILGAGDPIVLCAVDWLGIGNAAHDAFREACAAAAGTMPERVAVHALHQHDAPFADFTAEAILGRLGVAARYPSLDGGFARDVIARTAAAIRAAIPVARPLTHYGFGRARVQEVASNRRIVGADGKVTGWRGSTTKDAALRALPEGTIDPYVTALVFWSDDEPLAVLTAYACHPQSYYRTGTPSPDFPGIARFIRTQDLPSALHVHFAGAGGNVAAGKYNDGHTANRVELALRLASGMRQAFEAADRQPLGAALVGWTTEPLALRARDQLDEVALTAATRTSVGRGPLDGVQGLAWIERVRAGYEIPAACLRVGDVRLLHLPAELFVEYQLAAQDMRPDLHVMVAAYGDYGPAYIGTADAYGQGGYETELRTSFVGPDAEPEIFRAVRKLLGPAPRADAKQPATETQPRVPPREPADAPPSVAGATDAETAPENLHARLAARNPAALAAACRDRGDPRRGAIVFHTSAAGCAKCHRAEAGSAPLGPDLATLGAAVSDEHVVESILHPSARIRPGHEMVTLVLDDGTALNGIVTRQDADVVVVREVTDLEKDRVVPRDSIEDIVVGTRSPMPDGLAVALRNEQEFLDLGRYVMEIAHGGPSRARALQPRPDELAVRDDTADLDHAGILRSLGPDDVRAGRAIFMGHCRNCHGQDGDTPALATARAFGTQKLRFGADPYAMFLTLSKGNGLMAQVAHLSPRERYQVIHFIRETFMKPGPGRPGNPDYAAVDDAYLAGLPKGSGTGDVAIRGDRDFGPVLASQLGTEVQNSLTFRLPDAVTVNYDLHRMRFGAAWTGGFLDLSQTQHARQRGERMPQIDGRPIPGLGEWRWGFAEGFGIPAAAKPPRGPVRSDWLDYHGHYLHGDRAVLAYAIHGREVLECLDAKSRDGLVTIDHALWIAAGSQPLSVAVARLGEPHDPAGLVEPGAATVAAPAGPAAGRLAMVAAGPHLEAFAAAALVGESAGLEFRIDEERRLIVEIPAGREDRVVTILTAAGSGEEGLRRFGAAVRSAAAPLDPRRLTRGGPSRWPEPLTVAGILGEPVNGYALDTIPVPFDNPWNAWLRTSSLDFFSDGRAVVTTLGGDVYVVSGIDEGLGAVTWRRHAAGLFEPLGVRVVDDVVYVTCRDGLKRLHDLDGDGEADFIEAFWVDDDVSCSFHAFNFDLQTDSRGNFYFAQCGQSTDRPRPGSVMRVPPEGGTAEVVAWGLRTPNGLGMLPGDRVTVSDNQGPWMPAGKISLVTAGDFLGSMPITDDQRRWVEERYDGRLPETFAQPLVWTPQELDNSCGGQLWADDPRWGPLAGRLIHASYGKGRLCALALQEVDGRTQAAIHALPHQWDAGVMRLRTNPRDGQVYGTGLSGWQGPAGGRDGCLQRLRYAGGPVRFVTDVRVTSVGIDVSFSFPLDPSAASATGSWKAEMWDYLWSKRYGSSRFSVVRPGKKGTDPLAVESVAITGDGRTARLTIPALVPCDQVRLAIDVADVRGRPYSEEVFLTIHALPR